MKDTSSRVIDWILVLLAVLALLFGGYMVYSFSTFPTADYQNRIEEVQALTLTAQEEKAQLEKSWTEAQEAVLNDLTDLGPDGTALQKKLDDAKKKRDEKAEALQVLNDRLELTADPETKVSELRKAYALKIRELEDKIVAGESNVKICYWTLDDGPSYYTQKFLDYAKEADIYLTFFASCEANESPDEAQELRNMLMGGHSIGNHTYSHQYGDYGNVYGQGLDSFRTVVQKQTDWIRECTGYTTDMFRFPGGKSWALVRLPGADAVVEELGLKEIQWSCDAYDNAAANPDATTETYTVMYQVSSMDIAVLLSHDWNINTFYAMQNAVPQLKEKGYVFLPLFSDSWTFDNTKIIFG